MSAQCRQLKEVDFGSPSVPDPEPEQRELVTLRELMIMVRDARQITYRSVW
jgi:hypothetical protein